MGMHAPAYLFHSVPPRKQNAIVEAKSEDGVHQKHIKRAALRPSVTCKTEKLCSIL